MRRSFSFRARTRCRESNALIDTLLIYLGESPIDISVINDEVQNALKVKAPIPDVLYVLTHGKQGDLFLREWQQNTATANVLLARGQTEKFNYLKDFAISNFQGGAFKTIFTTPETPHFSISIESLLEDGLAELVSAKGAFQIAPTGHVFKHPSGKQSRHFLLTSELLQDEVDAYFVALCVCARAARQLSQLSTLYIDTMGIYPIARAIRDILKGTQSTTTSANFEICSFHSHDGLVNFQPSNTESAAVLISASTSGNMAASMCKDKGFSNENVITVLDLESKSRKGLVVYDHSKYADEQFVRGSTASEVNGHETPIELVGEYFAARGKRPKTLTLALDHAPPNLKKTLDDFSSKDGCSLQQSRLHSSSIVDTVTLAQSQIISSADFNSWLKEELRLRTPASTSHVLAAHGEDSVHLATKCAEELEKISGRRPTVVNAEQIAELQTENATGVVVCTALVGNGHALRVTARDLRELIPKASRHFIIGFGLPDTIESWTRLRQFLTQSGDSARPYLFASWRFLPIGPKKSNDSWARYSELMQKLEHVAIDCEPQAPWTTSVLQPSLSLAMSAIESSQNGMLTKSSSQPLKLTEGFVYWSPKEEQLQTANHQAISYLAISSVLQNAREFDNPSKRLKSTLYESVILDPENFLRFNDGVLQASLLRAANAFELDYSMTPDVSQSMREILEKIFLNHRRQYGEAAVEFAASLASGHLRLTDTDCVALLKKVVPSMDTSSGPIAGLLYYAWKSLPEKAKA